MHDDERIPKGFGCDEPAAAVRGARRGLGTLGLLGLIAALGGCAGSQEKPAATAANEPEFEQQADYEANPPEAAGMTPRAPNESGQRKDMTMPSDEPVRADDTGRNERDRNDATATPPDQSEAKPDVELTAQIRRAVVGDDALSFDAKNVKIITSNGQVTLRGTVESAAEKSKIEAHARRLAGAGKVSNQLEIEK